MGWQQGISPGMDLSLLSCVVEAMIRPLQYASEMAVVDLSGVSALGDTSSAPREIHRIPPSSFL